MNKNRLFAAILVMFSVTIALTITEVWLRLVLADSIYARPWVDERNLIFQFDPELGWSPIPNKVSDEYGEFVIANNSRGFRDVEHGERTKPRIAFLGDSMTWGYGSSFEARMTSQVQKLMPDWEVVNLGVSGYGTDQSLMTIERHYDEYQPELVFLTFCTQNDYSDNSSNIRYVGYYKPYFELTTEGPQLRGVPVPRSINFYHTRYPLLFSSSTVAVLENGYRRFIQKPLSLPDPTRELIERMNAFVTSKGARLVVGFTDLINYPEAGIPGFEELSRTELVRRTQVLRSHLTEAGIAHFEFNVPEKHDYAGFHWTDEGNLKAARQVVDFLQNGGLLQLPSLKTAARPDEAVKIP